MNVDRPNKATANRITRFMNSPIPGSI